MGMGRLNVWIHDRHSPCKISDESWLVNITYCSGEILEWCGKNFGFLDAKCGHLVYAFQLIWLPPSQFPFFRETHFGIVMVECDASACVQLYFPTLRQIVRQSDSAANILASERGPTAEIAKHLADAARALLEQLPKTGYDEALEHAAQEAASKLKKKGK